jgi:subtilisin-like proprotein convertase family protein
MLDARSFVEICVPKKMKKTFGILLLLLAALAGRASSTNQLFTVLSGQAVPDANPVGLISTLTVGGMSGNTVNLTVNLDITGGFNGDLYAYLVSPTGTMVVLLNRVGIGTGNPYGYGNAGFNITLDSASGNNIHNYQSVGGYTITAGQLTGTWAPDSRTILPNSAPSAFDAAPTGNTFANLDGADPNGIWTLFVADLAPGGQSTIVSWGLTVMTVPEPQTWTLLGGSLAAFCLINRKRRK